MILLRYCAPSKGFVHTRGCVGWESEFMWLQMFEMLDILEAGTTLLITWPQPLH